MIILENTYIHKHVTTQIVEIHTKKTFSMFTYLGKIFNNQYKGVIKKNAGVHTLHCASCPVTYIGSTYRNFKIRLSGHTSLKGSNLYSFSYYSTHLLKEVFNFDSQTSFKALKPDSKILQHPGIVLRLKYIQPPE